MVQTESKLENQLIAQLGKSGWQFRPELNHYSLIVNHFRVLLNRRNIDKLDGTLLTDQEFQRFLNEIVGSKSIYQLGRYFYVVMINFKVEEHKYSVTMDQT
ncbi:hypothetical protein [Leuconostoc mesenteroides]|uniref:hypothetical protein n=1 Tax=Leuconostoc mesenteroides TaxID=1245 RepID=UPI00235FC5F2|nr:hypothetical protein [Leuconostoc mesenteroides]